jgi:hypothetical protein
MSIINIQYIDKTKTVGYNIDKYDIGWRITLEQLKSSTNHDDYHHGAITVSFPIY